MQIGRYELIRTLGAGGSAKVLLAKSASGREVVLKIPLSSNPDVLERVRDEARVGLRLQHPHIVETLDLFEHDGKPILVVEFVDGASLSQLRRAGPLPAGAVVRVGREIAEALTVIHEATDELNRPLGMLHRDVTGANILVSKSGEAKLIDLGIARSVETQARQTQAGAIRGTIRYLAPELIDGKKHSPATDLWALGVVLWEAALGRAAVDGDDRVILTTILQGELMKYRPGEALDPRLHDALSALLAKEDARLQKAKAAANIMRRLEAAFGDGRPALAAAVVSCIAQGITAREGEPIGAATRAVLGDSDVPRPVTIPPPGDLKSRDTPTSSVTDPRAASSIDQALDDDRAPTVRMPAVQVGPPPKPAPTPAPVGSKSVALATEVNQLAPISTSDLSSVGGRYRPTDIVPAYTPSASSAPSAAFAGTEPTMPAAVVPAQLPLSATPAAPASAKRAVALTERHVPVMAGSAVSSSIATEAEGPPVAPSAERSAERAPTPVIPLDPSEPTAAGSERQFARPAAAASTTTRDGALPSPAPLARDSATLLETPAWDASVGDARALGLTASGFRPPDGAVHSHFAEPTREAAVAYVPPKAPSSSLADRTVEQKALAGSPGGAPPSSSAPPTHAVKPLAAPPSQGASPASPGATQLMHAGLAASPIGPSGTMPAMPAVDASGDDAPASPARAPEPARGSTPESAAPRVSTKPATSAPPAELSEKLPKPLAAPPVVSATLGAPPAEGATLTPSSPAIPRSDQKAATKAPAAMAGGGADGPPPPADDAFRPTVTQAFFTKDIARVMADAELGTSTLEMEAIRTPTRLWLYIGAAIGVIALVLGLVIAFSSSGDDEAAPEAKANAEVPSAGATDEKPSAEAGAATPGTAATGTEPTSVQADDQGQPAKAPPKTPKKTKKRDTR